MKLLNKEEGAFLSKEQIFKVVMATTIMVVALYLIAMVCSLCGLGYFLFDYHNEQLVRIESWFKEHNCYGLITNLFFTLETFIVLWFILGKRPKWYYLFAFYLINVIVAILLPNNSVQILTLFPTIFYLLIPIIDHLPKKDLKLKYWTFNYLFRLLIAITITFIYQLIIYGIKQGSIRFTNGIYNLEVTTIFTLEYDIALTITLYFVWLCLHREKGDSKQWATFQAAGGSSQTSMKQSLKSKPKKNKPQLSRTQKKKLRLLYFKMYIHQILAFLLLMILPFLLGKVFEFLMMYFAFALVRVILGVKYSLHFKKETLCISVGVIVFGVLTLVVPFFSILVCIAILMGCGLAVILHLSYKYRGMCLFMQVANKDRYADLFVALDADTSERHIKLMGRHWGLDEFQRDLLFDYMQKDKLSYLAKKYNYSDRQINYELDEIVDKITRCQ